MTFESSHQVMHITLNL